MHYVRLFSEINMKDLPLVGGKNASLGEMYQTLKPKGINIPEGFVITADAFTKLFEEKNLSEAVYEKLRTIDVQDVAQLEKAGREVRSQIQAVGLPKDVSTAIRNAYANLCAFLGTQDIDVAVRSSATAEDLPEASFAGQQETFLNVRGEEALVQACLRCFSSLFTDRAISYRATNKFDHEKVRLSIGVQQMVRSDQAASGVIFTLDTESGSRNVVLLTSSYGLGENVVAGRVDPDEFLILKPTLATARMPIIKRSRGAKQSKMVYSSHGSRTTKVIEVPRADQEKYSLSDLEVIQLARWACDIEEYYGTPMDIEWAKDGGTGDLFILQARPETVHSRREKKGTEVMSLERKSTILLKGRAVGSRIGAGPVRIIKDVSELKHFRQGEILVAGMTDPDWEPVMKKAAAIITDRGGRTCHAAIVSRELGVPCVVGTGTATSVLEADQEVTVSCAEGEEGLVMEGRLPFTCETIDWKDVQRPPTEIMVNLGNPAQALKAAMLPVDGVGLARLEFIIAEHVRVHPLALIHRERITHHNDARAINELIRGFESDPSEYFVQRLAEGIGVIAGAFYPRPVIVRLSDFKSNEYAHLLGGQDFEPREENPMIGFRGACRYYSERFREGFALECRALKYVREEMELTNVKIMVPFCRTAEEGARVIEEMRRNGLVRGEEGLEVYVMCELPSNVLDLPAFARIFDGFSIGSNDLTQMTLGVDRDSELVSHLFDERDPAAMRMLELAVDGARKAHRPVGICGQAPSDYPEIATFLLQKGIDSISLSPDSVMKTILLLSPEQRRTL